MKTLNAITLCFLIVAFAQCKKDKPYVPVKVCDNISNKKEIIDQYLQGSWKWLEDKYYNRDGSNWYNTPKTVGFQETVLIDSNLISFLRVSKSGKDTTVFSYKIVREGDLTTIPSDSEWVLAIYDSNLNLRNWWRVYICQGNLILSNAYRWEIYPDRIYERN